MPKTTVHKNYAAETSEHHVGSSRQVLRVKSVAKSHSMNEPANQKLKSGIDILYQRHALTSVPLA
jgi:hypothetical protein